ncbi:MAG: protein NO VEIN domain-containing protein, partial [Thermoguttaceae bacterium]
EKKEQAVWVHPGEPVFERFRAVVSDRLGDQALRGAVFVDPTAERPYLFHLALVTVVRQTDPDLPDFAGEEAMDCRLVGVRQSDGAEVALCPVEHLLLLKGGQGLPPAAQRLALIAENLKGQAEAFMIERVARSMAIERRQKLVAALPERQQFVQRGFDFQEAELARARVNLSEKARSGNTGAAKALKDIKEQQRSLAQRREMALATARREPELVAPGHLTFLAHALIVPSANREDLERHDAEVEKIAMELAWAYEESGGAVVKDVHTPELARAAGLTDNPGFDLLSIRPGGERRAIEVKGRAGVGDVEVSSNEWARAANLRDGYWLYAVYDCATSAPRLMRVRDPFGRLLAKAKGSMLISVSQMQQVATSVGGIEL